MRRLSQAACADASKRFSISCGFQQADGGRLTAFHRLLFIQRKGQSQRVIMVIGRKVEEKYISQQVHFFLMSMRRHVHPRTLSHARTYARTNNISYLNIFLSFCFFLTFLLLFAFFYLPSLILCVFF